MKYISVIAIKHGNQYISSVCYCDSTKEVFSALNESFDLPNSALYIVSQGDSILNELGEVVTFYRDLKYSWVQSCPVLMCSVDGLVKHAQSIGASVFYLYDRGEWKEQWQFQLGEGGYAGPLSQAG